MRVFGVQGDFGGFRPVDDPAGAGEGDPLVHPGAEHDGLDDRQVHGGRGRPVDEGKHAPGAAGRVVFRDEEQQYVTERSNRHFFFFFAVLLFFVAEDDSSGGPSTCFLVDWSAAAPVNLPVVEAVMLGTRMNQGIAFTSPGRVVDRPEAAKIPLNAEYPHFSGVTPLRSDRLPWPPPTIPGICPGRTGRAARRTRREGREP